MASDLERRRRRHNAGSCQPSVLLVIPSEVEESLIFNREIAGDVSTFARHDKTGTDALQMKIDLHTNILPPGCLSEHGPLACAPDGHVASRFQERAITVHED